MVGGLNDYGTPEDLGRIHLFNPKTKRQSAVQMFPIVRTLLFQNSRNCSVRQQVMVSFFGKATGHFVMVLLLDSQRANADCYMHHYLPA